ncbi:unnamed protein product [Prorocentrum cordatum]|uniref:Smr domain-containing protein n=1 Tax=Prorocentrum cordatum TaxID=2364126 RepID=A0ABN9W6B9_9DINO|nr:unnamed protein product [Polarella glacialis]
MLHSIAMPRESALSALSFPVYSYALAFAAPNVAGLVVLTGRGHHSDHGQAVLRPALIAWLRDELGVPVLLGGTGGGGSASPGGRAGSMRVRAAELWEAVAGRKEAAPLRGIAVGAAPPALAIAGESAKRGVGSVAVIANRNNRPGMHKDLKAKVMKHELEHGGHKHLRPVGLDKRTGGSTEECQD